MMLYSTIPLPLALEASIRRDEHRDRDLADLTTLEVQLAEQERKVEMLQIHWPPNPPLPPDLAEPFRRLTALELRVCGHAARASEWMRQYQAAAAKCATDLPGAMNTLRSLSRQVL